MERRSPDPVVTPGPAPPLGWTLSDLTRNEVDEQLTDAIAELCRTHAPGDGAASPGPACNRRAVAGTD